MGKKEIEKIVKELPILRNRSEKSREKVADSFMTISNNLWSLVFVSMISIPLSVVITSLFIDRSKIPTFKVFKENFDANFWILFLLFVTAIVLALYFRNKALKIYDTIRS
jgi:hypothetical protein